MIVMKFLNKFLGAVNIPFYLRTPIFRKEGILTFYF